jgi:outer membrane protein insertion porin family
MHFRKGSSLLLWMLVSCFTVLAQAQQQPMRAPIIAGITVEGVGAGIDAETVIAISGLRAGEVAGTDNIVMAIRNLWARKQYADVQIERERETALGVFLLIKVREFPRLEKVEVQGNDEISTETILKAVDKMKGDIMSPYEEYQIRQRVKSLYSKEGMLFAKVTSTEVPGERPNTIVLRLAIVEGVEYHVGSIAFVGNKAFDDSELAGAFSDTKTKAWWQFWKSSKFDIDKYKADLELLQQFYANKGYIDAEVLGDTVVYNESTEKVDITISLLEGQPVYIRSVRFEGNTVFDDAPLLRRLAIETGEPYNAERLDQNIKINAEQSDAMSLYADNGYLQTRLVPELIRVTEDSLDVVIRVLEGDRFTIRRVDFKGNNKTRDRVIRRELFTRPGEYFNRSAIIRSIRGLGVLNFFNPESLRPDVVPVDNTSVDIVYNVEERSTDTFNASVGFAGAFGLTGSIGITLNNFDITEPLRGGAGQVLALQGEFGQASRLQTLQLSFSEPWLFGQPTSLGFNVYDTRQRFGFDVRRTGAQVNVGRRFRFPDDYFRGDWSVGIERINSNTETLFSRAGLNTAITLSQTISRTSLDNIIFPTQGSRFILGTRFALGAAGLGTVDYGKLTMQFDMLSPLLKVADFNRLVLFMGSELGYVDGFRVDTTIPPQELYYMGGNGLGGFNVTPLRGYPDRVIGPGGGNGGRVQARLVAELRFALSLNPFPIYLLSFAEAGNVWANLRSADPFALKRSAGFGVRLLLQPIGLLGFDIGYGFDSVGEVGKPNGWEFHFQFGR